MGQRGNIDRTRDGHFVHANCDMDVIVSEEPQPLGSTAKPEELYGIVERFCLGRRRLELFGALCCPFRVGLFGDIAMQLEVLYGIVQRFCLGLRRLELLQSRNQPCVAGEDLNIRSGWVTVGKSLSASNFKPSAYAAYFRRPDGSLHVTSGGKAPPPGSSVLVPSTDEIESLRPHSPPRK